MDDLYVWIIEKFIRSGGTFVLSSRGLRIEGTIPLTQAERDAVWRIVELVHPTSEEADDG